MRAKQFPATNKKVGPFPRNGPAVPNNSPERFLKLRLSAATEAQGREGTRARSVRKRTEIRPASYRQSRWRARRIVSPSPRGIDMSTAVTPSPQSWRELYQLAFQELDPVKLPQRIA